MSEQEPRQEETAELVERFRKELLSIDQLPPLY
jgi:hypothetical protein